MTTRRFRAFAAIGPLAAALVAFALPSSADPAPADPAPAGAAAPGTTTTRDAEVLLIATYHFSNPGRDLHNVKVDDVLAPKRQAEIQAVVRALARFEPTYVGVEWPEQIVDERYAKYLEGTLPESRNEVVQLGFRLAKERALKRVHGLDVDGDFPYGAVEAWAKANGRTAVIDAFMAEGQAETARITAMQTTGAIGSILRYMNEPASILRNHSFYPAMLRMGGGPEQPGVALLASWYQRNLAICARLLQSLAPGERAVVFYGQGHVYLLNQCLDESTGVRRVDPLAWL